VSIIVCFIIFLVFLGWGSM